VLCLKERIGLFDNAIVDVEAVPRMVATDEHTAVARRIAEASVTALENDAIPLRPGQGAGLLVVSNGSVATIEEDLGIEHLPANEILNREFLSRCPDAGTLVMPDDPTPEDVSRAAEAAAQAEIVVFALFTRVRAYAEHGIRIPSAYADLIRRTRTPDRTVICLNFGNPWMIADLPRPDALLCTFSDARDSVIAAVDALFGEMGTRGRLPVDLSDRYPFGYGL